MRHRPDPEWLAIAGLTLAAVVLYIAAVLTGTPT